MFDLEISKNTQLGKRKISNLENYKNFGLENSKNFQFGKSKKNCNFNNFKNF